jgi:hypothetical protein
MAFRTNGAFHNFLKRTGVRPILAEWAPAHNFLLEERVLTEREDAFLGSRAPPPATAWDVALWFNTFGNYFSTHIAVRSGQLAECTTFTEANLPNILDLEPHRDVVRMESISGLFRLTPSVWFDSADKLADGLRALCEESRGGPSIAADDKARLTKWLEGTNGNRDGRPMFASPFGEVKPLLARHDWAGQVRDVLGLAHLIGTPKKPLHVALMRYNLSRVQATARRERMTSWGAVPTILEAGSHLGPNSSFFPCPVRAHGAAGIGFGATVDLDISHPINFKSELLHLRVDYQLSDFLMIGEVNNMVDDGDIAEARARHLNLLDADLQFRGDLS